MKYDYSNKYNMVNFGNLESFPWGGTAGRFMIVLVRSGGASLKINDAIYALSPRCMLFIRETDKVEFISSYQLMDRVVSFHPVFINQHLTFDTLRAETYPLAAAEFGYPLFSPFLKNIPDYWRVLPLIAEQADKIERFFDEAEKAYYYREDFKWFYRTRAYLLAAFELIEQIFADYTDENEEPPDDPEDFVAKTLQYIALHYTKQIKITELAALFGTNRATLAELFKNRTGLPFNKYVIRYRINLAKSILRFADLSLGEVAKISGYTYCTHFEKQFLLLVGLTPVQYRNNMLEKWDRLDEFN